MARPPHAWLRALSLAALCALSWSQVLQFNITEDAVEPLNATLLQYDREFKQFLPWPASSVFEIACEPNNAAADFAADFDTVHGTFKYMPNANYFSKDTSDRDGFTYQVTFKIGSTEVKRLQLVQIYVLPVNDRPFLYTFEGETYPMVVTYPSPEDAILDNTNTNATRIQEFLQSTSDVVKGQMLNQTLPGQDVDGDFLTWTITRNPQNGTLIAPNCAPGLDAGVATSRARCRQGTDSTGNRFVYIPDPFTTGRDDFEFVVDDSRGNTPGGKGNVPALNATGIVQLNVGAVSNLPTATCTGEIGMLEDAPPTHQALSRGPVEPSRAATIVPGLRYFLCDPRRPENAVLYNNRPAWVAASTSELPQQAWRTQLCDLGQGQPVLPCGRDSVPTVAGSGADEFKRYVNESAVLRVMGPALDPARNGTVRLLFDGREQCGANASAPAACVGADPPSPPRAWFSYTPSPNAHGQGPHDVSEVFFFNIYGVDPEDCLEGVGCLLLQDSLNYPGGVRAAVAPVNDPPTAVPQLAALSNSYELLGNEADPYIRASIEKAGVSSVDITIRGRDFDIGPSGRMGAEVYRLPAEGRLFETFDGEVTKEITQDEWQLLPDVTRPREWDPYWGANATATWTVRYQPPPMRRGNPLTSFLFRVRDKANNDAEWGAWSAPGRVDVPVACAPGYRQSGVGDNKDCVRCEPGLRSKGSDYEECTPCAQGRFSPGALAYCEECGRGTYQDEEGAAQCKACPLGSSTSEVGAQTATDCRCSNGYFGPDGGPCLSCPMPPEGRRNPDNTTDPPGLCCDDGDLCWTCCDWDRYPEVEEPLWPMNMEGYFVTTSPSRDKVMSWYRDAAGERVQALGDGAPLSEATHWTQRVTVTRCTPFRIRRDDSYRKDGFPEGLACQEVNSTAQLVAMHEWCAEGYDGARCAECAPGFYRANRLCNQCPENAGRTGLIIGVILALFAPIAFKLSDMMGSFATINITLGFSQVTGLFARIPLSWPDELKGLFEALDALNFNVELVHPGCETTWSFSLQWTILMLSPLLVLCLLLAVFILILIKQAITRWITRPIIMRSFAHLTVPPSGGGPLKVVLHKFIRFWASGLDRAGLLRVIRMLMRAMLTFLHLGYVFLSKTALSILDCVENRADGNLYLKDQPSTQCYVFDEDDEWGELLPFGVVAIVAYCFGILALLTALLWSIQGRLERPQTMVLIGFMYYRFEGQWYAYELAVMLRKMLVVLATVMFSTSGEEAGIRQAVFSIGVLVLALFSQLYARPYDSNRLDRMETVSISSQAATLFSGIIFRTPDNRVGNEFRSVLKYIVLILQVVAFIFQGIYILLDVFPNLGRNIKNFSVSRRRKKVLKARKARWKALEKEGGDALDKQLAVEELNMSLGTAQKVQRFASKLKLGKGGSVVLTPAGERLVMSWVSASKDKEAAKRMLRALEKIAKYAEEEETLLVTKKDGMTFDGRLKKDRRVSVLETLSRLPRDDNVRAAEFVDEVFKPRRRLGQGASLVDKGLAKILGGGGPGRGTKGPPRIRGGGGGASGRSRWPCSRRRRRRRRPPWTTSSSKSR